MNMLEAYLIRFNESDQGTFGSFSIPEAGFSCFSVELPDRKNERNFSRIPAGRYLVRWKTSPKYSFVAELQNVQGRSGILIHSANYGGDSRKGFLTHLQGCIGFGDRFVKMSGQNAVTNSKSTILAYEKATKKQDFMINII